LNIKSISIIGLGLIGGSIAKAIKNTDFNISVSAFDKENVLEEAFLEGIIDKKLVNVEKSLDSDLIFLCTPVDISIRIFEFLAPKLKEKQIITDVCGVKEPFRKIWDNIKSEGEYFGGHPMTGKEISGYKASDPLLFENSVYILSDCIKNSKNSNDFFDLLKSFGCRLIFLSPEIHDEVVANVSHVPQLVSVSLVNSLIKNKKNINFVDFAGGGFKDMTRIASSKFDIWKDVISENKNEIFSALENLINELIDVRNLIVAGDGKKLSERFEKSRLIRDAIPKTRKGFLTPLYDLFVFVKDEPGVVAKISSELFKMGINIKDIELLKIREGAGGTFRVSFESEKDALIAEKLMKNIGYHTKFNKEPKLNY